MTSRAILTAFLAGTSLIVPMAAPRAPAAAQAKALSSLPPRVENRTLSPLTDGARHGFRFDARAGDGVAWWPDAVMGDGTLAFDVRGRDLPQQSFVGAAFRGVDRTTFDVVYFRPFNFRAPDAERRAHSVQYVSLPGFDWQKLRTEHPGMYEQPLATPPDPNGWFQARVVLAGPDIRVFVNDASVPVLQVRSLHERARGWVGIWVGNGSAGDFANVTMTPAP